MRPGASLGRVADWLAHARATGFVEDLGFDPGIGRLTAEDLLLGLALEELGELLLLDRLALEQDVRDRLERLAALGEDVLGALVGALDDAADLVVDLARDLVGVVGFGRELAAE